MRASPSAYWCHVTSSFVFGARSRLVLSGGTLSLFCLFKFPCQYPLLDLLSPGLCHCIWLCWQVFGAIGQRYNCQQWPFDSMKKVGCLRLLDALDEYRDKKSWDWESGVILSLLVGIIQTILVWVGCMYQKVKWEQRIKQETNFITEWYWRPAHICALTCPDPDAAIISTSKWFTRMKHRLLFPTISQSWPCTAWHWGNFCCNAKLPFACFWFVPR